MATKVLLNMYLLLNGTSDVSSQMKSCRLALDAAQLDATAMGDGWVDNAAGLKSGTLTIDLLDDFADNSIDEIIWALFLAGTNAAFAVKPEVAAISTSNPEYQGFICPTQWSMGGGVGELAQKSLTYPISGAVTRDVTP